MPTPLTWDMPGLTWDSGATWDGTVPEPTKKNTMNTKAIIDFSGYTAAELSGSIVARYKPDRQQSTNEVQTTRVIRTRSPPGA
jgi:hypothetical protein